MDQREEVDRHLNNLVSAYLLTVSSRILFSIPNEISCLMCLISCLFRFIILLTSIFTFFFFGEIRNLTTFTRLMDYNNGFSISSFFLSLLSFLWIGAQFPQEKFLSYGRILTLHYYFLLMCIFISLI